MKSYMITSPVKVKGKIRKAGIVALSETEAAPYVATGSLVPAPGVDKDAEKAAAEKAAAQKAEAEKMLRQPKTSAPGKGSKK